MFVDTSALVAIILEEPEFETLVERLDAATQRYTSPVVVLEAVMVLTRYLKQDVPTIRDIVTQVLQTARVEVAPIDQPTGLLAIEAFDRYGKGRDPAKLNMGDCLSYGAAKARRAPLLYKGDDFARTDLR